MGATQGCSSMEKMQSCSLIQPVRPSDTVQGFERSSSNSKSDAAVTRPMKIISLWAKCKGAVHELGKFQKFLRRRFAGPNEAFDYFLQGCKNRDRDFCEYIVKDDFVHGVEKAGFKGNIRVVFAILKADTGDFITRHSFRQKLKARDTAQGDKFFKVVRQAVATAALVEKRLEATSERFEEACDTGAQKISLSREGSNGSLDTESTTASSNACHRESDRVKERERRARTSLKEGSTLSNFDCHRIQSTMQSRPEADVKMIDGWRLRTNVSRACYFGPFLDAQHIR